MHNSSTDNTNIISSHLKLPDKLQPYLILLTNHVILPVCLSCQIVVLPRSLLDHLRKYHQLPSNLRKDVISLITTLPSLDFNDVPSNPDGSTPVEALRVVNAFQCKQCAFIRRDVTDVRKHVNSEHKISATGGYEKIRAQSWFGGRRAVYWRVCDMRTEGGWDAHEGERNNSLEEELKKDSRGEPGVRAEEYLEGRLMRKCGQEVATDTKSTKSATSELLPCRWGFFGADFWYKHPEGKPRSWDEPKN
ncbi:hypothetical protein B7463_g12475, partial [Scytalidium lignicola]